MYIHVRVLAPGKCLEMGSEFAKRAPAGKYQSRYAEISYEKCACARCARPLVNSDLTCVSLETGAKFVACSGRDVVCNGVEHSQRSSRTPKAIDTQSPRNHCPTMNEILPNRNINVQLKDAEKNMHVKIT